jgi:hypothetical protein
VSEVAAVVFDGGACQARPADAEVALNEGRIAGRGLTAGRS